jgi:hypothetical protein
MEVPQRSRGEQALWDYQLDLAVVPLPLLATVALPECHDAIQYSYAATSTTITATADYFFSIARVELRFLWAIEPYHPLVRLLGRLVEWNTSQHLQTFQAASYTLVVLR